MSTFTPIPDMYETIGEVADAMKRRGLQRCDLMLAVDFTKSNSWNGKMSFRGRSLHDTQGSSPNPYERVVTILGRTVEHILGGSSSAPAPILAWGFGDASTSDAAVFSFMENNRPASGFQHVLSRYRDLAKSVVLSGPTSFGPAIRAATVATLERGCPFTVLVLIADGQVTRSEDTPPGELSPQERDTIDALVSASACVPLAVIMIGVGDGPWDEMILFDDMIPERRFDNWQFVEWGQITASVPGGAGLAAIDAAFALACLQEVPAQYEHAKALGLLNRRPPSSVAVPRPPRILPPPLRLSGVARVHATPQAPHLARRYQRSYSQPSPPPMSLPAAQSPSRRWERSFSDSGDVQPSAPPMPMPTAQSPQRWERGNSLDGSVHPSAPPMRPQSGPGSCVVCLDAPRDSVLLPCGHFSMCMACAAQVLQAATQPGCPICRAEVKAYNRVFLA